MPLFQNATFFTTVANLRDLPHETLCEVAFAGRSNAGKSSAINTLANHTRLAFVSKTPGRTQNLNYFQLAEGKYLVDLPGYGYAKAPKSEVKAWQSVLRGYLRGRPGLTRAFVLIDSRTGISDLGGVLTGFGTIAATLQNGAQITPALSARFDAISRSMPEFHYGRYDIRFSPSKMGELKPDQQHEFGLDFRTGRPVIATRESLERVLACYPSGVILGPTASWGSPTLLNPDLIRLIEAETQAAPARPAKPVPALPLFAEPVDEAPRPIA